MSRKWSVRIFILINAQSGCTACIFAGHFMIFIRVWYADASQRQHSKKDSLKLTQTQNIGHFILFVDVLMNFVVTQFIGVADRLCGGMA